MKQPLSRAGRTEIENRNQLTGCNPVQRSRRTANADVHQVGRIADDFQLRRKVGELQRNS